MKRLLLLALFFVVNSTYAQLPEFPLQSSGSVPSFLKRNLSGITSEKSLFPSVSGGKKPVSGDHWIHQKICSSGLILFGDSITRFSQAVLEELKSRDKTIPGYLQVYTIKSTTAGVFSIGDSLLMVSTGLVTQLSHPDQLSFFMLRQINHLKENHRVEGRLLANQTKYEEWISSLCHYSIQEEYKADSLAVLDYQKCGFDATQLPLCIDVLAYSYLPFEDYYVPANYFSSPLMYVPTSFFDVLKHTVSKTTEVSTARDRENTVFIKRRERIKTMLNQTAASVTPTPNAEFYAIRKMARFQSVHEFLVARRFYEALYTISILEKDDPDSDYLARMKCHTWLGLVSQLFVNKTLPPVVPEVTKVQNESIRFYKTLNQLNSIGKAAFALRIVTDCLNSSTSESEREELLAIQQSLVKILAISKQFPLEKFSKQPMLSIQPENKTIDSLELSKYDKLKASNEQLQLLTKDTNQFYFYAISDLMNQEAFLNAFKLDQSHQTDSLSETRTSLHFVDPMFRYMKRKSEQKEKSKLRESTFVNQLPQLEKRLQLSLRYVDRSGEITATDYNEKALYSSVMMQLHSYSNFENLVVPLEYRAIRQLKQRYQTEHIAIMSFEHCYSLKPKGYHMLGLMVAPLPFVGPDLLIGGNRSQFTMLCLNLFTGKVENVVVDRFRDPLTTPMIDARVYMALMGYKKSLKLAGL